MHNYQLSTLNSQLSTFNCQLSILLALLMMATGVRAQGLIPDGYYTIGPLAQEKDGYLYFYDTDALRNIYGNAADYSHPYGKNGEHAYLYSASSKAASLAGRTYYFSRNSDDSYTIQSCSGEPYSYLDVARYDRHLVTHSAKARQSFFLHDSETANPCPEGHYVMQQVQQAALFYAPEGQMPGTDELQVITPVDSDKVTPALTIRRALGSARGILALYPSGDNPGEVTPLLSSALADCIEEAQTLADDKNTTPSQAEEVIQRLKQSARAYEETAPSSVNPVSEGYYWITSAYRAFELRQGKQKVMRMQETDGQMNLRWNNTSINDGTTVFLITPDGDRHTMQDYQGRWTMHWQFRYDTEGMFTIADAEAQDFLLSADDSWVGEKGLYGKPTEGPVTARSDNYLYPGYCSSWRLQRAYHQVTVSTSGWAVLSVSFPAEIPEDVEVFSVAEKDGALGLVPYTQPVIPARTAVVLYAPKGTYTFWSTTQEVPPIENNVLVANCEDRKDMVAGSMALLKVKNGQVGFQKSTSKQIAAGSAYIPYSEGQEEFRVLQDAEDGLIEVDKTQCSMLNVQSAYDLSGRSVPDTHKGVVIVNKKKMLKR